MTINLPTNARFLSCLAVSGALLLLSLSACAQKPSRSSGSGYVPLTELQYQPGFIELRRIYVDCLFDSARRYEPLDPSAENVALAAEAECRTDKDAIKNHLVVLGGDPILVERAIDSLEPDLRKSLIKSVLELRELRLGLEQ